MRTENECSDIGHFELVHCLQEDICISMSELPHSSTNIVYTQC